MEPYPDNRPLVKRISQYEGHQDAIYRLEWASGTGFFSAGGDGMVVQWNLEEPNQGKLIAKSETSIYALGYNPSTQILAIGKNNEGIQFVEAGTLKDAGFIKTGAVAIYDILWLGDDVYAGLADGSLVRINFPGLKIEMTRRHSEKSLRCLISNTKTGVVAAGYSDCVIRLLSQGDLDCSHQWKAHDFSVFTLGWESTGKGLLSGSRDAKLKRWRIESSISLNMEVNAHLFALNHLQISPDGQHLITCSMDKTVKLWDAAGLKLLRVLDHSRHGGHRNSVNRVMWLDNLTFVSAGDDRSISIWRMTNPA